MQFKDPTYTRSEMIKIVPLDGLICIIGLIVAVHPILTHNYPADIDTTAHVALGMLIATPAAFRVLTAYASLWVEVVLFFLGLIVLCLPTIMKMQWNREYNTAHLALGGAVMVLSILSLIVTIPVARKHAGN
jgi:hypothetical protein